MLWSSDHPRVRWAHWWCRCMAMCVLLVPLDGTTWICTDICTRESNNLSHYCMVWHMIVLYHPLHDAFLSIVAGQIWPCCTHPKIKDGWSCNTHDSKFETPHFLVKLQAMSFICGIQTSDWNRTHYGHWFARRRPYLSHGKHRKSSILSNKDLFPYVPRLRHE